MKKLALVASVVGLLGGCSTSAFASSIYIQPPLWSGNGSSIGTTWTSQTSAHTGFVTFDTFSFAATTTINEAIWYGVYLNPDFTNGVPNTPRWDTLLFDSTGPGGSPLTLLGGRIDNLSVQRTTVGTGLEGSNTVTVYQFVAQFPDFTATAGIQYYFAPVSVGPTLAPFSWIQGTGGDGQSFQAHITNLVQDGTFIREGDRAFALTNVPEPSTIALLFTGLGGLAANRRRRRS